jgi:hypothetical protein
MTWGNACLRRVVDLNQDGIQDVADRVVQFDYGAQIQHNVVMIYLNDATSVGLRRTTTTRCWIRA